MTKVILALLLTYSIAFPAMAADIMKQYGCPALSDPARYDANGLGSYKTIFMGKNDRMFRDRSDFKTSFFSSSDTLKNISRLNTNLKNKGSKLVVFYTPTRGMIHFDDIPDSVKKQKKFTDPNAVWKNYDLAAKRLQAEHIEVVTLAEPPQPISSFFYKRDHHWNADGARLSAKAIADYLKNDPAYKSVSKEEFVTQKSGLQDHPGAFRKVFKTLCHTDLPPEKTQTYETAGSSGDTLLGGGTPQIVLTGTSNSVDSASHANFSGYLKEYLHADIANYSISGGGLDEAMLNYLKSEDFKKSPAKIIIWEVPAYYSFNASQDFFNEAIALTQ